MDAYIRKMFLLRNLIVYFALLNQETGTGCR
jgi:hypothetical protein